MKQTTLPIVRSVGVLELLGGVGVVAGPLAGFALGWTWATVLGLAAAAGLALTMATAAILHIARGEFKYTWKMNLGILALAIADVVVIAFI